MLRDGRAEVVLPDDIEIVSTEGALRRLMTNDDHPNPIQHL